MRPPALPDLQNIKTFDQLKNFVTQNVKSFYSILNKGGFFRDQMNIAYVENVPLSTGSTTKVVHNLGSVPIGYIVVRQTGFGSVYWFPYTDWTDKYILLTTDGNGFNCDLFILKG